ncbi:hypothetical protein [Gordonia sp. C13]|uniref:hypothetical protein n=1 Tax=Gordonia sp. C13 TaxID=2935078 RepID=UPI00200B3D0E|nr:hypothetical protein [Gordonia sp. C13]MCK8615334.1 hypothetical protein [Gordonia sp. C13]
MTTPMVFLTAVVLILIGALVATLGYAQRDRRDPQSAYWAAIGIAALALVVAVISTVTA